MALSRLRRAPLVKAWGGKIGVIIAHFAIKPQITLKIKLHTWPAPPINKP